jgi:hypothetical protein
MDYRYQAARQPSAVRMSRQHAGSWGAWVAGAPASWGAWVAGAPASWGVWVARTPAS